METDETKRAGNVTAAAQEYGAGVIKQLSDRDHVRLRPAMYIGDTAETGFHHLVYEVIDNSIDEAMAGHCTNIQLSLNADGSCSVADDGRGIPVDPNPHDPAHRPTVEVALAEVKAGGKFNNDAYKVSGGLHGVGVSCVNILSDWLECEVRRGGKIHRIRFSKGETKEPLHIVGECAPEDTGTTVSFHPDTAIFHTEDGGAYSFSWERLVSRLRELSFLNPGVRINVRDERPGQEKNVTYFEQDGIRGYVGSLHPEKDPITPEVVYFAGDRLDKTQKNTERRIYAEVAMRCFNDLYKEEISSFANNIHTEGGVHLEAFNAALVDQINQFARERKLIREKDKNFSQSDVLEGVTCIISVKVPQPQFVGQTKNKLAGKEVRALVKEICSSKLEEYFNRNVGVATKIIERAIRTRKIAEKIRTILKETRESEGKFGKFLGKLADCSSRDPRVRELFLVEGDSAGGSAKGGRDRKNQAILPLRGKVLNVQKASLEQILANNEIKSLVSAIGAGFGNPAKTEGEESEEKSEASEKAGKHAFDVTKIRYDKVIIMTDADVDGAHIRTLLLTFFYNQMRPLIEHGHVFLAQPPLYGVSRGSSKKGMRYLESDAQLSRHLVSIGSGDFNFERPDGTNPIPGSKMPELLEILRAAEDICQRLENQRIDMNEFFGKRNPETGEFPHWRVITTTGGEPETHYVFDPGEIERLRNETAAAVGRDPATLVGGEDPNFNATEILLATPLRRLMDNLRDVYHFPRGTFRGNGTVLGDLVESKENGQRFPIASLMQFLDIVRTRGRKGLNVQRFKGLGEMNASELFDTTMDPRKRKLLKVTLEDFEAADKTFSVLMGDEVAPRRKFIEDNALSASIDA